jgi:hypothetical protein
MKKMELFSIEDSRYIQVEKITNEIKKNYVRFEKGYEYLIQGGWIKILHFPNKENDKFISQILKELEIKYDFKYIDKKMIDEVKHQILFFLQKERKKNILKKLNECLEIKFCHNGRFVIKNEGETQEIFVILDENGAILFGVSTITRMREIIKELLIEQVIIEITGGVTTIYEATGFLRKIIMGLYQETREYKLQKLYLK